MAGRQTRIVVCQIVSLCPPMCHPPPTTTTSHTPGTDTTHMRYNTVGCVVCLTAGMPAWQQGKGQVVAEVQPLPASTSTPPPPAWSSAALPSTAAGYAGSVAVPAGGLAGISVRLALPLVSTHKGPGSGRVRHAHAGTL